MLARPLPDYPITYPVEWGWPAPFAETPGQTLNAWLEGMPASMYCTAHAQRQLGVEPPTNDDAWRAEHDAELVFFVGFDNLFIWALVHVAELIAHEGRYVLPDTILCNEFYELENEKFSTSKGHVVLRLEPGVPLHRSPVALAWSDEVECLTFAPRLGALVAGKLAFDELSNRPDYPAQRVAGQVQRNL